VISDPADQFDAPRPALEAALAEHEGVAEVAVFGIPDERWGEAVHATVIVRPGSEVGADALIKRCRTRIAGFKTPRSIELGTEPLSKSGAGKVLKNRLRDPYWRAAAGA